MAQALPEKRFTRSQMTRQRRKLQTWRAGYRAAYWTPPPPPSDKEFADALLTEAHTLPPPPPGLFLVHAREDAFDPLLAKHISFVAQAAEINLALSGGSPSFFDLTTDDIVDYIMDDEIIDDLRMEASTLEYEVVDDSELEHELVDDVQEVEDIQFRRPFRPKQGDLSRDVSELDGTASATSTPVRSQISLNGATMASMAPPLPQTQLAASKFEFSDLCGLLHQMSWKYYIFKQWNDFDLSEESDDEDDEVEDTLQAQFMFFLDHWFRQNDTLAMSDVVDMMKNAEWDHEELKLVLRSSEFRAKYMAHATRDCIMLV